VPGALPYDVYKRYVDEALAKAPANAPAKAPAKADSARTPTT
jgi:hypothetical protein